MARYGLLFGATANYLCWSIVIRARCVGSNMRVDSLLAELRRLSRSEDCGVWIVQDHSSVITRRIPRYHNA